VHVEVRRPAAHRRQLAQDLDVGRLETDLLLRLSQRGREQALVLFVVPPARKGELSAVVAVLGPDDQDETQIVVGVPEDGREDGG
jgi:hypothetical protein